MMIIAITLSLTINNAYSSAGCPDNTKWNGENCVQVDTGESMTFTYLKNPIDTNKKEKSNDRPTLEIINTISQHETLNNSLILKPKIKEIENMTGKALEQKIMNDSKNPKNLTRYNYYFNDNKKISIKNAEFVFYEIVFGKEIQNPDFGKNLEHQIDYSIRYNRSEDPVLQNAIIKEQKHAEEIFLKAWGNFTNY